ncbi:MAG: hypothetical protein LBD65_00280, partial [Spirochaetaceae bacterium]|nr:hypothetical protein [Spirochaetaceae bacterium]
MKTRREIFEAHYRRYQQAGKNDKGKILDDVAGTTGLNRDHLAQVLSRYGKQQASTGQARPARKKRESGKCGGRPPKYHQAFVALLTRIWEDHGRPCGKLLAPL